MVVPVNTKECMEAYLEGFFRGYVYHFENKNLRALSVSLRKRTINYKELGPFVGSFLSNNKPTDPEVLRVLSSIVSSTFEEAAKLIALGRGYDAERNYRVEGYISQAQFDEIGNIVNEVREHGFLKNFGDYIRRVVAIKGPKTRSLAVLSDVFVGAKRKKFFFEIKSPKPNKGQCLEVLERFLRIQAVYRSPNTVKTYYAMPYNPYGARKEQYSHWPGKSLDLENEVLLGPEFWDLIGGPGTYTELLNIYRKVGKEKGPDIIQNLIRTN